MTVLDAFALTGKRALVTGGNRGLGLAFVRGLAEAGADVVFVSRDAERNAAAVATLADEGLKVQAFEVDITAPGRPRCGHRRRRGAARWTRPAAQQRRHWPSTGRRWRSATTSGTASST